MLSAVGSNEAKVGNIPLYSLIVMTAETYGIRAVEVSGLPGS